MKISLFLLFVALVASVLGEAHVCFTGPVNTGLTLAEVKCPPGQVVYKVTLASYGNPTGTCENNNVAHGTCNAPSFATTANNACIGKNQCNPAPVNNGFYTDCPGATGFAIKVTCYQENTIQPFHMLARDGTSASITCQTGSVVKEVEFASYGAPCYEEFTPSPMCNSGESKRVVERECIGHQSCFFYANTALFGDPCYGYYKTMMSKVTCADGTQRCNFVSQDAGFGIVCAGSTIQTVNFASYGLPQESLNNNIPPRYVATSNPCHQPVSLSHFLGTTAITIPAVNHNVFVGYDHCPGQSKHLAYIGVCAQ